MIEYYPSYARWSVLVNKLFHYIKNLAQDTWLINRSYSVPQKKVPEINFYFKKSNIF